MKTKLTHLLFMLACLAGVQSALAQAAKLGLGPAGQQFVIYWPLGGPTNYVLQTTTDLASSNWVTASNALTVNAVLVSNGAPFEYFRLTGSATPAGMTLIPAGPFTMGNFIVNNFYDPATNDPDIADASPTNVFVSAFYMDVNLVSPNLWAEVYAYATSQGYNFNHTGSAKSGNHPVQSVDWFDCVKWSNARSQQAGLTPVYYTDAAFTQLFTNGFTGTTVYANWLANGYRLPTEAEWEKAARGGLTGNRFPWGNIISERQANYPGDTTYYSYDLGPHGFNTAFDGGAEPYTSPVGSFAPNGYGLYDMAGNVLEWCWDWYAPPPYPAGSPYLGGTDPRGPAFGALSLRVYRGGSWSYGAGVARCAGRSYNYPDRAVFTYGFRCVRGL
jgi:formylglycine-generating enzyme required for sulfatase activity